MVCQPEKAKNTGIYLFQAISVRRPWAFLERARMGSEGLDHQRLLTGPPGHSPASSEGMGDGVRAPLLIAASTAA